LPVANGGTGSTTQNFVDLTTNQTILGVKTFSSDISVNGVRIGRGLGNNGQNVAIGAGALASGTGTRNTAVGYGAMRQYSGTSYDNNTSIGYFNLPVLTSGNANTSVGAESMMALSTGVANTSVGNQSLINITGSYNVGIGQRAGQTITTGSQNTIIGTNADVAVNNLSNATAIGYDANVAASNTIQLGNTSVTNVKTSGTLTADAVTYPKAHGTAGQVLSTTGSGTLAWTTPSTTATAYSGTLPVANGGTGAATLTANNVLLGNGTSALQAVAPGATGNVLTSNGTTWTSAAASGGTHTIGESYGGGIVFYVTTDGLHGLIAETQDQSSSCSWYNAQDIISTTANHSTAGKLYTDWRLPTKYELNLLYLQKSVVGGFLNFYYWSSSEGDFFSAWLQDFTNGVQINYGKGSPNYVRAVRAF